MALDSGPANGGCRQHPHIPATRGCDGCGILYCADCLVPLRGRMLCGACKHVALSGSFQSYQVIVPTRAGISPPAQAVSVPTVALNSPCALHEHQEAVAVCDRCGDFLCLLCLTPFEGRSYCLRCFDLLWERGEIGSRKKRSRWYEDPTLALFGAIITWATCFIPVVSLIPAASAVTIAILALKQRGKDLRGGERATAIAAIVLAVLGALGSVFIWVSIYTH